MCGLHILKMRVGGRLAMREKIHVVELDYLLHQHDQTLLWIGLDFVELIDDDVPTNKEQQLRDQILTLRKRMCGPRYR